MKRLNPKLVDILRQAGWEQNRCVPSVEDEFRSVMGDAWIAEAAPFVRSFGNLAIDRELWVFVEGAILGLPLRRRLETIIGCPCCPIAHTRYVGDGGTLWIDSKERMYVVDSEGVIFVGENTQDALNVLLLGAKPLPPPEEIREPLENAYEWNNGPKK